MNTVEDLFGLHRVVALKEAPRFGQGRGLSQSSAKDGERMTGVVPPPPFDGPAPGKTKKADKRPR